MRGAGEAFPNTSRSFAPKSCESRLRRRATVILRRVSLERERTAGRNRTVVLDEADGVSRL